MKITLPKNRNITEKLSIDTNFVVVGANGSGKTNFAAEIDERYPDIAIRMTQSTYSQNFKELIRSVLSAEQNQKKLPLFSSMKRIWNAVSPNRLLEFRHNTIQLVDKFDNNHIYPINEMGETERLLLFVIASVIHAPKNSLLIIDEPEMHIKKSIIIILCDLLESFRKDCTFVYLTHDVSFASSRHDFLKVWLKDYNGDSWNYEILSDDHSLPNQLYFELLAERKSVLFIEGDSINSLDYKLLHYVFPDYLLKPLGGCEKVMATTKSLNEQEVFHDLNAYGLVDRDRRSFSEIQRLTKSNVWVTKVAEIENFLLLEDIIKVIAYLCEKNGNKLFQKVKINVLQFFREEIKNQALEYTMAKIDRVFSTLTGNSKGKTFEEMEQNLEDFWKTKDFAGIYHHFSDKFHQLIQEQNYQGILEVFNEKTLIGRSDVCALCGIKSGNKNLLNFINEVQHKEDKNAEMVNNAIKKNIINHQEEY
ncbi:MAG: DUF4435 domain-containing protein [Candidatus Marinimicrobia bacterium]|nr:DUF4435 domain-containing protein [Candidatus Neomarinimicrobiota bacterium]